MRYWTVLGAFFRRIFQRWTPSILSSTTNISSKRNHTKHRHLHCSVFCLDQSSICVVQYYCQTIVYMEAVMYCTVILLLHVQCCIIRSKCVMQIFYGSGRYFYQPMPEIPLSYCTRHYWSLHLVSIVIFFALLSATISIQVNVICPSIELLH